MSDIRDFTDQHAREFARRLRRIRERKGLTQAELGEQAGLSPAAISQLETEERRPNFKTLLGLSRALEVTPDVLMGVETEELIGSEMKALFRKLQGMSSSDFETVKSFVAFMKVKGPGADP